MKSYTELAMEQVSNALAQNIEYVTMTELTGLYPYRDVFDGYIHNVMDYKNRNKKSFKNNKSKIKALRKVLSPKYIKSFKYLVNEARAYGDKFLSGKFTEHNGEDYAWTYGETWNKFIKNNEMKYNEIYDFLTEVDHKENRNTYSEVYYKNDI